MLESLSQKISEICQIDQKLSTNYEHESYLYLTLVWYASKQALGCKWHPHVLHMKFARRRWVGVPHTTQLVLLYDICLSIGVPLDVASPLRAGIMVSPGGTFYKHADMLTH